MIVGHVGDMRDRHQTRRRAFGEGVQPLGQRPQHQPQPRRRGLQQRGHEDRELAKAHAVAAQGAPRVLIQILDLGGDRVARQDAKRLDQAKGKAARQAGQRLVPLQGQKRLEQGRDLAVDEMLQAALDLVGDLGPGLLVHEDIDAGMQRVGPAHQLADGRAAPHQPALFGIVQFGIGGVVEPVGPQVEFRAQRLVAGAVQHPGLVRRSGLVGAKAETFQTAGEFALDRHFALVVHFGHEALLLLEPAQQHRGPPVHKSLGQGRVQGIRQAVFYRARLAAPMAFVLHPAGSLRDIGPCADVCQPLGQRVDVALRQVDPLDRFGQPVRGDRPVLEKAEDPRQQRGMLGGRDAAEIGHAAHVPQQPHVLPALHAVADFGQVAQGFQRLHVVGVPPPAQQRVTRRRLERFDQPVQGAELQFRIAPGQPLDRGKAVVLDGVDQPLVQDLGLSGHAEGAGFGVPPGASRDLADLVREQRPDAATVELVRGAEGDMADVQVQAHADGVGGDQVIDLSGLIHRHLGVARARRQRAHDHCAAALLPADQFGHGIDVIDGKADDGRPRRHPRQLFRPRPGQGGQPVAPLELHAGDQMGDGRAHRVAAQQQRLVQAAHLQQAVGEDMAAFGIGAKLDFVDGDEIGGDVGHRLGRRHPVLDPVGNDPFLARDQGHDRRPARPDDPVIDLARQQPQRQADHAGAVGQHPFDGVMGFPGIGRAQDGRHPAAFIKCHASDTGPVALPFQPRGAVDGLWLMGMDGQAAAIGLQRAVGIAGFLEHRPQLGQRRKVAGLELQDTGQIRQGGAELSRRGIGHGAGVKARREIGGVVGQRGQVADGIGQVPLVQGGFAPLQQQIQGGRSRFRPFAQNVRFGDAPGLARGFGQASEQRVHVGPVLRQGGAKAEHPENHANRHDPVA